ncbi:hypothetical protein [Hyphobacterium sp.]|uniref:hypothetical protein n=1 Tax=Hyphobacterium sp. TaxID=2004662 RepID=UPI003BAC6589
MRRRKFFRNASANRASLSEAGVFLAAWPGLDLSDMRKGVCFSSDAVKAFRFHLASNTDTVACEFKANNSCPLLGFSDEFFS